MNRRISFHEVYGCCGAGIFFLQGEESLDVKDLVRKTASYSHLGQLIIIVNGRQHVKIGPVLAAEGWELVAVSRTRGEGTLYTYIKIMRKPRSDRVKEQPRAFKAV